MKIYIAAKFEDKEKARELFKQIKSLGHQVAYDWTEHRPIQPYSQNQELAMQYSDNELFGILDSDIFICLFNETSVTSFMEFGEALALNAKTGKPLIYVVGDTKNKSPWFFNSRVQRRNYVEEVIEEIKKM